MYQKIDKREENKHRHKEKGRAQRTREKTRSGGKMKDVKNKNYISKDCPESGGK